MDSDIENLFAIKSYRKNTNSCTTIDTIFSGRIHDETLFEEEDFKDSECGQEFEEQMICIDFAPTENDEVVRDKCFGLWRALNEASIFFNSVYDHDEPSDHFPDDKENSIAGANTSVKSSPEVAPAWFYINNERMTGPAFSAAADNICGVFPVEDYCKSARKDADGDLHWLVESLQKWDIVHQKMHSIPQHPGKMVDFYKINSVDLSTSKAGSILGV